ncbi:MAG: hypothetical protein ACYSUT_08540 [Planctomycetota bacterium]|jgi:hypothetical protein
MRNTKTLGYVMLAASLLCWSPMVFSQTAEDAEFHTLVKDYDVKLIYVAADHVMFNSLSLTRKKDEDCNCSTNKADALTGRIEATSADGITFAFRIHYLDETTCGVWIEATQDSGVAADLAKYCQLIYDKTVQRLAQKPTPADADPATDAEPMEFAGDYDLSIAAIYKVMNETANHVGVGHSVRTRNNFTVEGAFTSSQTQFNYKAYLVADNKLKFRFWKSSRDIEGDRYIYETVRKEFQKQLKLAR